MFLIIYPFVPKRYAKSDTQKCENTVFRPISSKSISFEIKCIGVWQFFVLLSQKHSFLNFEVVYLPCCPFILKEKTTFIYSTGSNDSVGRREQLLALQPYEWPCPCCFTWHSPFCMYKTFTCLVMAFHWPSLLWHHTSNLHSVCHNDLLISSVALKELRVPVK